MNRDSFFAYLDGASKGALAMAIIEGARMHWPENAWIWLALLGFVLLFSIIRGVDYWKDKSKYKCHCAGCERERRSLGGYQPCVRNCTENISPPPKNR